MDYEYKDLSYEETKKILEQNGKEGKLKFKLSPPKTNPDPDSPTSRGGLEEEICGP